MDFEKKINNTINKYQLVQKGDKILLGVSGGADSIALLNFFFEISIELNLELFCVHINHNLRYDESDNDEIFVREFCLDKKINFISKKFDIKKISKENKTTIEETARNVRYQFFKELLIKFNAQKIAVAHNENDQAETIIMNIIRGTGPDGIAGMDYINGEIIRPLLNVSRKEIEKYLLDKKVEFRIDSSNSENLYTRNKVRNILIPQINQLFNIDISESIQRLSNIIKHENNFIENQAHIELNKCIEFDSDDKMILNLIKIKKYEKAIQNRIIRMVIYKILGNTKGLTYIQIKKVIDLINSSKTGKKVILSNDVKVVIDYNNIEFIKVVYEDKINYKYILKINEDLLIQNIGCFKAEVLEGDENKLIDFYLNKKSNIQYFDLDKINSEIYIRNRLNGDRFKPYKFNGTKKIKEYFIDLKISKEKREKIPLLVINDEIIWIVGIDISSRYLITKCTKNVLKIEFLNFFSDKSNSII